MIQANGELLSQPDPPKPRGNYTGERLKALRPETYRRVMELLAEPREQVPYDHICRLLRVSEHTVKAIEKAESASIAERKQRLLAKALRIANKAADRIEDQIDGANITQAVVAFGVATDKAQLLSGDATARLMNLNLNMQPVDLVAQFEKLHAAIREANAKRAKEQASVTRHQLALSPGDAIADSVAETDLEP
jgi:hypothetical protein